MSKEPWQWPPVPYPGMSRTRAWDAFSGAARALFDPSERDDQFWRMVRFAFDRWWRDYKNARGPRTRISDERDMRRPLKHPGLRLLGRTPK